jgi:hypothetical protein
VRSVKAKDDFPAHDAIRREFLVFLATPSRTRHPGANYIIDLHFFVVYTAN